MEGKRYDCRSQLMGRVKNDCTKIPASDFAACECTRGSTYRHALREEFLEKVENGPAQAQAPHVAKFRAFACSKNDSDTDSTCDRTYRKELLYTEHHGPVQAQERSAPKMLAKFCADCNAPLNEREQSNNFCSKVAIAPYEADVSRTQSSAERFKRFNEKKLRSKGNMLECEGEYPHEHQQESCLSGGYANSLLSDGVYATCSDKHCGARRACDLSSQKIGKTPAKSPPQRQQENNSFRFTESDLALSLGSDGDRGSSSRTVSRTPSVREIRRIMTARCRAHDIVTTSLKNMGYDDDDVAPSTDRKQQSPAQHRRVTPSQLNEPSRTPSCVLQTPPRDKVAFRTFRVTPTKKVNRVQSVLEANIEGKPHMSYTNSKPPKMSPTERRDPLPVTNPPSNPRENLQKQPSGIIPTTVLLGTGDDFEKTVRNAIHAQAISPVIQKMEKMHYHLLRSQLSLMGDIAALPTKITQLYKEHLQNLPSAKDGSGK